MSKNNPQPVIKKYIFVFQNTSLLLKLLRFAEDSIKIVVSEEHRFSKTKLVKKRFFIHPNKYTLFQKRFNFWFWAISAETTIRMVCPGFHCFGQKQIFGQNR